MKTVTVTGTFTGSINNFVRVDIYRANPDAYDFSKNYSGSFGEVLTDLLPGLSYFVDLTGFTAGSFDLTIAGDIVTPISDHFTNSDFKPGYLITVTP